MSARPWKKYKLDNGDVITVRELARLLDISENSARVRLCKFTDPEKIYQKRKPDQHHHIDTPVRGINPNPRLLKTKPFNDPMFKLAMIHI